MTVSGRQRIDMRFASVVVAVCLLLSGCTGGAPGIPMPGGIRGETYDLDIEFANVLNIPDGAKVLLNGNRVGELRSVTLGAATATTRIAVRVGTAIPASTRAELRQTTLLGDIYIALIPPAEPGGRLLHDGDRIPVRQTVPPDNVETVMVGVSQFINGGVIARSQNIVRKLNDALPDDPRELEELTRRAAGQLVELGSSTNRIDSLLSDGANMVEQLADRRKTIERALAVGPERFGRMQQLFLALVDLIADLRILTKPGGDLLVEPVYSDLKEMLGVVDPLLMTVADADRSLGQNAIAVRDLIAEKITPFLGGRGEVDVQTINRTDGTATQVADVLRAIGVV